MKTSTLTKIKKENTRLEKITPYNFCDRWCEKCPKRKRSRCKLYHKEFDTKLQHLANGRDPDDIYVMLGDFEKSIEESTSAISKLSEEKGIDLPEFDSAEYRKNTTKHPLYQLALDYLDKIREFLNESSDKDSYVKGFLFDSYETIRWYHMPITAKSFIILWNTEHGDFLGYCNAVSQIKILRKSCRESKKALEAVMAQNTHQRQRK